MPVRCENLTNRPVFLTFNSHRTLHLGPKGISEEIFDSEVRDNRKIKKLRDRHVIAIHELETKRIQRMHKGPGKKKEESPEIKSDSINKKGEN